MKKLIRDVDEKKGIVQITTYDERWYAHEVKDPITGIPFIKFVPSVTWVAESYPKGIGFYRWLAITSGCTKTPLSVRANQDQSYS
jgi:hypothetical protein